MWRLSKEEKPENDKFFGPKDIVLGCTEKKEIVFAVYDEEKDVWINPETKEELIVEYWDYIIFPGQSIKAREVIKNSENYKTSGKRNSMGCLENWYDPEWALCNTFSKEEILRMSDKEIENLLKLGEAISDGLY